MKQFYDAFISYGRADSKAFAIKLNQKLMAQGLNIWFDQEDIPLAVDYQEQINSGIEQAHNFIFIIAPHSVNSKYCLKEINQAIQYNKRIIPLLHVERISQETWHLRNPNQTQEDWQEYQAKGLDSSFPNMHPTISKINWIYCRENIDNFASSFQGLINAIDQHQEYVAQHTEFLVKALDWSRNQKQRNYLLINEERQAAETWLKYKFVEEQSPCNPTDLHCEFICESIKNANNLMTQVFLSASDQDNSIKEKIGKTLMRECFTIWTNQRDIKTGTDFEKEIQKGIEGADNFVYFISPDTLASQYCQQEFAYAAANNKRIIPLLVQETDLQLIPSQLQELQRIDITGSEDEEKYRHDIDKLLKALKSESNYYEKHKLLLVKALKWHKNNRNLSFLLRGYNLQHFESWLKVAQQRQDYPPLPLQEEFIAESLQQPKESSLEVFISYSYADSDFARQLNDALIEVGKLTWFEKESIDQESIADFQQEIYRGIENSDNFLFIISPKSVNSSACSEEVEYAQSLNKRIVTVVYQPVPPEELHPVLAKIQWINFNQHGGDLHANFPQLVRTIDTDREHVHSHTKWSQEAREWAQKDKTADLLLRGSELLFAQKWLEETEQLGKQPLATDLQKEFITASQKAKQAEEEAEQRRQAEILRLQKERTQEAEARLAAEQKYAKRQKFYRRVATIGFMITSALGLFAVHEYIEAKISEIEATSLSSVALFVSQDKLDALIEAIKAKQQLEKEKFVLSIGRFVLRKGEDSQSQVEQALQQAVFAIKEYNRLSGHNDANSKSGHNGAVLEVAFSPDGKLIASGSTDNTIKIWNRDGQLRETLTKHEGSVNAVAFSPDGQRIASASKDQTVKLWNWDGKQATLIATLKGHEGSVNAVAFSPDGQRIASASKDQTVKLWKQDGTLLTTLEDHEGSVNAVAFSPDGQRIASASKDQTVKLWKQDGNLLKTLKGDKPNGGAFNSVVFSPNGKLIAAGSADKTIKIWQQDGKFLRTLEGHREQVWNVAFSPDSQKIVSASADKTFKLWKVNDGSFLMNFRGHSDLVTAVDFSPDGEFIVSGSEDNSVRLWKPKNSLLDKLFGHENWVKAVAFSPDGQLIASGSNDKTVKIWQRDERDGRRFKLLRTLEGHSDKVKAVAFRRPDGKLIASASADQTVKIWQRDGRKFQLLRTLEGHDDGVNGVAFSPDGQLIASASADQTVKIWQRDGTLLRTLEGHSDEVNAVVFSPDGQLVISGSADNTIKIWQWDGNQATLKTTLDGHKSPVFALDISPDGQLIISGSGDNTVKLWTIDGKLLETREDDHSDSVLAVKFHPNPEKTIIASASVDKTIKLWQWDGNKVILRTPETLMGHSAAVESIDFSPDGKTLASGSNDRTVILWTKED
ncbi:MAG: TIR domain-containing protein, partial [Xenococcus sp. MO_188.B8]|nr:TIR domain-containing protein [Xenococcus sp. MO_188.B8]